MIQENRKYIKKIIIKRIVVWKFFLMVVKIILHAIKPFIDFNCVVPLTDMLIAKCKYGYLVENRF